MSSTVIVPQHLFPLKACSTTYVNVSINWSGPTVFPIDVPSAAKIVTIYSSSQKFGISNTISGVTSTVHSVNADELGAPKDTITLSLHVNDGFASDTITKSAVHLTVIPSQ